MRPFRWAAGITALLLAAGLAEAAALASGLGVTPASVQWMALFAVWGILLAAAAGLWIASLLPAGERLYVRLAGALGRVTLPPSAALGLAAVFAIVLPALVLTPLPDPLGELMRGFWWRAVIFWLAALAGTVVVSAAYKGNRSDLLFAGVCIAYAAVHRAAAFLPDLSMSPFSLGWSEGSRYYNASLFFSERVYGVSVPPGVLHPTRYLMQAAPFLLDGLPIWVHRLWQVFLWLAATWLAAWVLVRREGLEFPSRTLRLLAAAWGFLFLFQGPVWYHLAVMPAFLFWGIRTDNYRRTLLAVVIASLWAGISRVNWIPFPAALAALIYLVEVPQGGRPLLQYVRPVLLWGVAGVLAGFMAQAAYESLSGNPPELFGSAYSSDLLWYRLFPNATFPLGVLPGILLATLPAALAIWWAVRSAAVRIDPLRWLGIAGILSVFLLGGLVVSVKIGGGSNLHNMDGYLVLLLALAVLLVFRSPSLWSTLPGWLVVIAAVIPAGLAVSTGAPFPRVRQQALDRELAELVDLVEGAGGEPVLFIAERQLLVFGEVEGVGLEPDYEKVFLMEMAMAGNDAYLGQFEADLAAGRFALIVSDRVNLNFQGREDDFGEENNAWDEFVTFPLLCHYREVVTLEEAGVEVLAPRAAPQCPEVEPGGE